jgi:hypothetical protein
MHDGARQHVSCQSLLLPAKACRLSLLLLLVNVQLLPWDLLQTHVRTSKAKLNKLTMFWQLSSRCSLLVMHMQHSMSEEVSCQFCQVSAAVTAPCLL